MNIPTKLRTVLRTKWPLPWQAWAAILSAAVLVTALLLCRQTPVTEPQTTTAATTPPSSLEINPLSPRDFIYQGEYLTCLGTETYLGIDVSVWQEQIDWPQVKDAGIRFAMIRLGYRGTKTGELQQDTYAQANYQGAKDAGILTGAYFFSQAVSVEEAVEEAEFVLEMIGQWALDMPIVYDWEHTGSDTRTANVDRRTLTDCTIAFCRTVEEAGYEAMVYFNEYQSYNSLYLEELAEYPFWLAQYGRMLDYEYRVNMWQYTDRGTVPGIKGNVDLNLLFVYE